MKKLLNTLYIFTDDAYLTLEGENVVAKQQGNVLGRVPLHTIEAIQCFSYAEASPALMGACSKRGIALSFFTPSGRFLAEVCGRVRGNVLLRREQFRIAEKPSSCLEIARNFILAKVFNSKWILERAIRDHGLRLDTHKIQTVSSHLSSSMQAIQRCSALDELRGIEGDAAASYFSVFDALFLRDKETFTFTGRTRRPPKDAINAMLSFFYSVLERDCSSALESVGLDPYVGFFHVDRPGRRSLALDCMEEFRPLLVDRFVATAVNNRIVNAKSFDFGALEVRLNEKGRKALFKFWQERKKETITHPFLNEKVKWGILPSVQAQLLAKAIRGDLDGYPPLFWK